MSIDTSKALRKLLIYQVYIRNHTNKGTFNEFVLDLNRIKDLGVDVVYLIPIHEIGEKQRKGDLGSPYSIKDFRSINSEYGTIEDFNNLVKEIHHRGMKLMIDIVYNHTSYDSILLNEHPEYFFKKDGVLANKVGDWWDITDLDYTVDKALWKELIDTLVYWTELGVDGFRWDVASFLPLQFLEEAHNRVLDINPDTIFLSESVHGEFLQYIRNQGYDGISESQIYQVFDMSYDYDIHPYFEQYLKGKSTFKIYLEELKRQEYTYPENYIKLRNLENHDFGRFAPMVDNDIDKINNWTACSFFQKGSTMIYAGQENCDTNKPSLFDKDIVNWNGTNISPLITTLGKLVKEDIFAYGIYNIIVTDIDVFIGSYEYHNKKVMGLFNVGLEKGTITIDIPDGSYTNLIDDSEFVVKDGNVELLKDPIIFYINE